jgi:hypothetical protein
VITLLGIAVPDDRPVFLAALAMHIAAGSTCVVAGALAATASKRAGRHPRAGVVYLAGLAVVIVTAAVMTAMRWREDWHLVVIAVVAGAFAAVAGWLARRHRPRRWLLWHGAAMAGSYIALLTGFYVDNGPQLPPWDRLPSWSFWLIPAGVGIPLTLRALSRNGAWRVSGQRRATPHTCVPPPRP